MALRDTENIVRAALDAGLIGGEDRRLLLEGLPMGFVYSLPTVSRPIDQLRFDLMELTRTPRLIGLDRAPLAVWLENAVTMALGRDNAAAAAAFAAEADRLLGGDANRRRVDGAGTASSSPGVERSPEAPSSGPPSGSASTPSAPPAGRAGHVDADRTLVWSIGPDTDAAWRSVDPPIDGASPRFCAGDGLDSPGDFGSTSYAWRRWADDVERSMDEIRREARPRDTLTVFPDVPVALCALIGARMRHRLRAIGGRFVVFEHDPEAKDPWQPWGPAWSEEEAAPRAPVLVDDLRQGSASADVALRVELAEPCNDHGVRAALAAVGGAPSITVEWRDDRIDAPSASEIESIFTETKAAIDRLRRRHRNLERLHLFYTGPRALMLRLGHALQGRQGFETRVYHRYLGRGYGSMVRLGGGRSPGLDVVERSPEPVERYDVFIAYPSPERAFVESLKDKLDARGLTVFFDRDDVLFGDDFNELIPRALACARVIVVVVSVHTAKAFYEREEIARAIHHLRSGDDPTERIVPILLDALEMEDRPYGLESLQRIRAERGADVSRIVSQIVRVLPAAPAARSADGEPAST